MMRMSNRIKEVTNKIKKIRFPFKSRDFQVQEVVIGNYALVSFLKEKKSPKKDAKQEILKEKSTENLENLPKVKSQDKPENQEIKTLALNENLQAVKPEEQKGELSNDKTEDTEKDNISKSTEDPSPTPEEEKKPEDVNPAISLVQEILSEIITLAFEEVEEEEEKIVYQKLFTSRHLFEVELQKYKSILEQRKFFGFDRIEQTLIIGKKGLLQNRKNMAKSKSQPENDVEKYYNKLRDHNKKVKKAREKFQTQYYQRYPEKLEQLLKEEQEK